MTDLFTEPEAAMTSELLERPATALTPLEMIGHLIERPDFDPERLGKMLELQERWERNQAATRFANALTSFQAQCPVVEKTRTAKVVSKRTGGEYKYKFANLEDVMETIKPYLDQCKLGISFSTESTENSIKATCRIRHGTHCEDHTLTVPVPEMTVNDTQRFGAALSYAKRYALCAALNVVVADEDTDANGLAQTITDEQCATIREWMEGSGADEKRFCKWLAVERIADIPAVQYEVALRELQRKAGQKK